MKIPDLIQLEPNRVFRTYSGGRTLDQLSAIHPAKDSRFPEDWVASTVRARNIGREDFPDEGMSCVSIKAKDIILAEIMQEYPEHFFSSEHLDEFGPQPGFLLKLLDSSIRLHIQCHPTIKFSREKLSSPYGKTEGYIILGFRDEVKDPYIYLGFQNPPDPEKFKNAIERQDTDFILSCFEKIPINEGDVFVVPGGLPHAIGEGVLMVEIMEPSDLAVRIEFEREGIVLPEQSRFMGRDADFAVSMFSFEKYSMSRIHEELFAAPKQIQSFGECGELTSLIDRRYTECFCIRRLRVFSELKKPTEDFHVGIVTRGTGQVCSKGFSFPVKLGDRFLVCNSNEEVTYSPGKEGLEIVFASRR